MYQDGIGAGPIQRKYHCSQRTVFKILDSNNIEHHNKGSKSPYSFDEHFLDALDSPDKLYLLGWLFSDGSVNSQENLVTIGLSIRDIEILEKLNSKIKSNRKIEVDEEVATLKMTSKHFKDRLIELGCIPNKSLVLTFPEYLIDNPYLNSFILGFFDGDGGISNKTNKNGNVSTSLSFTSTKMFNERLKEVLKNKLNLKHLKLRPGQDSQVWILTLNVREEANILLNWMYKDATLYLNRKHKKFLQFSEAFKNIIFDKSKQHYYILDKTPEILERSKKGESGSSIARDLGINKSTVCRIIKRYNNQRE